MIYLDKPNRKVVAEIFNSDFYPIMRKRLTAGDYKFTEQDVFSNQFWGRAFHIERPRGKGASARLTYILDVLSPLYKY